MDDRYRHFDETYGVIILRGFPPEEQQARWERLIVNRRKAGCKRPDTYAEWLRMVSPRTRGW